MGIVFWVSALVTVGIVLAVLDALAGERQILDLRTVTPDVHGPRVSIIVAARNEAHTIEHAVGTLLTLSYPALELIVVNDRSTDGTAEVLSRLALRDSRLQVVTVDTLPPGWLGKNHALALGASAAHGEILLFADADILFEPSLIGRAVRVMRERSLDHLTALPDFIAKGVPLTTLVLTFGVLFTLYTRPWKARDPKSRHHLGVGAFNMVRRTAYERIGTHATIALRVDDDLRLGRAIKEAGLRQDVVLAHELLAVEWYPSVPAMIDGLTKNAFAGIHYSVSLLLLSTVALLTVYIWPWVALISATGTVRLLSSVSVLATSALVLRHALGARVSPLYVFAFPCGVLGFLYILWRSAVLTLTRGAVTWRETSYPLADLRRAIPAAPLRQGHRPDKNGTSAVDATTV